MIARSRLLRPLRDRLGRWLHKRIDEVASARIQQALLAEREARMQEPRVWGPRDRLEIASSAVLNDALLNTMSGRITIADHVFFGHDVAILTGTHDITETRRERALAIPTEGNDIVIHPGVWVSSRAMVLGPCVIGADAVIAAGSVVSADVPERGIVAGAPARLVGFAGERRELPESVRVLTDVGTLLLHAHDEVITPLMRRLGRWEEEDRALLEAELAPGASVVDVGANVGYMTLAAAKAVGPSGAVIAVEPHPANVALLEANLKANGLEHRVTVVQAAAWDTAGEVDLAECATSTGDHRVDTLQGERSVLAVRAVRLDDVVPDGVRVSVIKLDTQATEDRVLAGARGLLARDRPVVLAEFWPQGIRERGEDPAAVLAGYRTLGYRIEVPLDPELQKLGDEALVDAVHAIPGNPHGGFVTLRLRPQ